MASLVRHDLAQTPAPLCEYPSQVEVEIWTKIGPVCGEVVSGIRPNPLHFSNFHTSQAAPASSFWVDWLSSAAIMNYNISGYLGRATLV